MSRCVASAAIAARRHGFERSVSRQRAAGVRTPGGRRPRGGALQLPPARSCGRARLRQVARGPGSACGKAGSTNLRHTPVAGAASITARRRPEQPAATRPRASGASYARPSTVHMHLRALFGAGELTSQAAATWRSVPGA